MADAAEDILAATIADSGAAFDIALASLLPVLAWAALAHPRIMAGVMLFISYGIILSLAWFRLDAPDIAVAEAAIGAGLTGVLLIGTLARLGHIARSPEGATPRDAVDIDESAGRSERWAGGMAVLLLALGIGGVGLIGFAEFTDLAVTGSAGVDSAGTLALAQTEATGLGNAVNAVLLSFRVLDTLLEKSILMIALLGVVLVGADGRPAAEAPSAAQYHRVPRDSNAALGLLTTVILPVALVTAGYLVAIGADRPGGAFQGGTVAAAGLIVAVLSGRLRHPAAGSRLVTATVSAAIAVLAAVLAIASVVGPGFGGIPFIGGDQKVVIIAVEIALTVGIAVVLAALALGDRERWPQMRDADTTSVNESGTDPSDGRDRDA
ncbi:hydrogenase subunit MbhD domain-containing protein [Fodinicurvata sp. EGI_FJ10296]|uniref:hydrogenase subunit MbhD domain-containing protein n=1 Tax=Fodinicurvata sp. EGI_FJ10296 TaxID=3231908 RepID=UPI003456C090